MPEEFEYNPPEEASTTTTDPKKWDSLKNQEKPVWMEYSAKVQQKLNLIKTVQDLKAAENPERLQFFLTVKGYIHQPDRKRLIQMNRIQRNLDNEMTAAEIRGTRILTLAEDQIDTKTPLEVKTEANIFKHRKGSGFGEIPEKGTPVKIISANKWKNEEGETFVKIAFNKGAYSHVGYYNEKYLQPTDKPTPKLSLRKTPGKSRPTLRLRIGAVEKDGKKVFGTILDQSIKGKITAINGEPIFTDEKGIKWKILNWPKSLKSGEASVKINVKLQKITE